MPAVKSIGRGTLNTSDWPKPSRRVESVISIKNEKNKNEIKNNNKEKEGTRKESKASVATVETLLGTLDEESAIKYKEVDTDTDLVSSCKQEENRHGSALLIKENALNFALLACCLVGASLILCGYWFEKVVLIVCGIGLISFSIIILILKCVIHFTSLSEREKVLPYIGFRYRTDQGWLSKDEIFRRSTGVKGCGAPKPGPNHFF